MKKNPILTGTLVLTVTGFITRLIGFFYRIYLSRTIGAEGLGIYQLLSPVLGICFAICAGSIQTAISRFVAAGVASGKKGEGKAVLRTGILLSGSLSLLLCAAVYFGADLIAGAFLLEPRCAPLLRILAFSIPMASLHTCICGYYYGLKKASVPAFAQLVEQCIRVLAVYLIAGIWLQAGKEITVTVAVLGLLCGDTASALFAVIAIALSPQSKSKGPKLFPIAPIVLLMLPLTANRLLLTVLQSIESVMLPNQLQGYGMTVAEALSVYGVLTGMALPFILFPSAVTNSMAVMLLPTVAEAQSGGNDKKISRTTSMTLRYSLYMGILCISIFILFGNDLGMTVFHNSQAGSFIRILAWLCPFLYMGTTLGSILNGLGKTTATFIHSMIALTSRLLFVIFLVPRYGIIAYLWGHLVSQILVALLHLFSLGRSIPFHFDPMTMIVKPTACVLIAVGIYFALFMQISLAVPGIILIGIKMFLLCLVYGLLLLLFHSFKDGKAEKAS